MKNEVISYLTQINPLPEAACLWLRQHLRQEILHRHDHFLRAGEVSNRIAFITKGMLRSYEHTTDDLHDTTVWFMKEFDVVISVWSFFFQQPAEESIVALEDTTLYYITYAELQEAYRRFNEINTLGRMITERYYAQSEHHFKGIRNRTAAERFAFLQKHQPELLKRATRQHLASYLDMSKTNLCRFTGER